MAAAPGPDKAAGPVGAAGGGGGGSEGGAAPRGRSLAARLWQHRAVRFLATGGINTAFGYLLFFLCQLVMAREAAVVASGVMNTAFGFFSYGKLTFGQVPTARIVRHFAVYAVLWAFNIALLDLLVLKGGLSNMAGQALCVPVYAVLGYALMRRFVYNVPTRAVGRE
jgi:putative flippase GtrA